MTRCSCAGGKSTRGGLERLLVSGRIQHDDEIIELNLRGLVDDKNPRVAQIVDQIIEKRLSVREVEVLVKKISEPPPPPQIIEKKEEEKLNPEKFIVQA